MHVKFEVSLFHARRLGEVEFLVSKQLRRQPKGHRLDDGGVFYHPTSPLRPALKLIDVRRILRAGAPGPPSSMPAIRISHLARPMESFLVIIVLASGVFFARTIVVLVFVFVLVVVASAKMGCWKRQRVLLGTASPKSRCLGGSSHGRRGRRVLSFERAPGDCLSGHAWHGERSCAAPGRRSAN